MGLGLTTAATGVSAMSPAATGAAITAAAVVAAPVLLAGGVLVAGGAIAYGAYRALRPRSQIQYHDKVVKLEDLKYEYWSCYIHRVGVVGVKRSGKTEIKTQLRSKGSGERDTEYIETHILHADESVFVALIDGRGAETGERDQQFEIADQADLPGRGARPQQRR